MSINVKIINDDCGLLFIAEANGQKVGELELAEVDGTLWFGNVWVKTDFQKMGIGTALVKRAIECHGLVYVAKCRSQREGDSRHLSTEGAALMKSCIRRGILPESALEDPDNMFDERDKPVRVESGLTGNKYQTG